MKTFLKSIKSAWRWLVKNLTGRPSGFERFRERFMGREGDFGTGIVIHNKPFENKFNINSCKPKLCVRFGVEIKQEQWHPIACPKCCDILLKKRKL